MEYLLALLEKCLDSLVLSMLRSNSQDIRICLTQCMRILHTEKVSQTAYIYIDIVRLTPLSP